MNHPLRPRHGLTGADIVVELDGDPGVDGRAEGVVRGHVGPEEAALEPRLDDAVHGKKRARRPAERARDPGREAVPSRDPVRAYLRDMGAGQTLSREEEVALAMRIEAARDTVVARLCAIPAVVGRVHGQHVVGELGTGKPLGHDVGIPPQGGHHVLGQPVVAERLTGGRVAEHDPGAVAVRQPDGLHRAACAGLGERGEGVVADGVAPTAPLDGGHGPSGR